MEQGTKIAPNTPIVNSQDTNPNTNNSQSETHTIIGTKIVRHTIINQITKYNLT